MPTPDTEHGAKNMDNSAKTGAHTGHKMRSKKFHAFKKKGAHSGHKLEHIYIWQRNLNYLLSHLKQVPTPDTECGAKKRYTFN